MDPGAPDADKVMCAEGQGNVGRGRAGPGAAPAPLSGGRWRGGTALPAAASLPGQGAAGGSAAPPSSAAAAAMESGKR